MENLLKRVGLAMAIGLAASAPAFAVQTSGTTLAAADRAFMVKAAEGGMMEVQLGQLAQKLGKSAQVRSFGSRMVADHTKANKELMTIATSKGIPLPKAMNQEGRATYDRLSKLSGDAFDKAYMDAMAKDHQKDAKAFGHEVRITRDPQLKTFATRTLHVVTMHGHMAMGLDKQMTNMGGGAGTGMGGDNQMKP